MVVFLAVVSGSLGVLEVAAAGTVLGFAPDGGALVVLAACWFGMVVASIVLVVWGGPRRLVPGMLGAGLAFAVGLGVAAFRPNLILMATGGFIAMGALATIIAVIQTTLQTKVEPHLLGTVVGLKNTVVTTSHIVGDVGAIVVGVYFFSNNFRVSGMPQPEGFVSSPVLAAFIGDGPGRGWALVILLVGVLIALMVLLAFRSARLRRLQDDLPDVTPEDRLPQAAPEPDGARRSRETYVPAGITASAPARR
jgi:hypothetical protein